jgi:hypothetical protein
MAQEEKKGFVLFQSSGAPCVEVDRLLSCLAAD